MKKKQSKKHPALERDEARHIAGAHLTMIELLESSIDVTPMLESNDLRCDLDVQATCDAEATTSTAACTITVRFITEESRDVVSSTTARFTFQFTNLNEVGEWDDEGNFAIPQIFADAMVNTSYSTIRGIVFMNHKGTPLHNLLLPVTRLEETGETS